MGEGERGRGGGGEGEGERGKTLFDSLSLSLSPFLLYFFLHYIPLPLPLSLYSSPYPSLSLSLCLLLFFPSPLSLPRWPFVGARFLAVPVALAVRRPPPLSLAGLCAPPFSSRHDRRRPRREKERGKRARRTDGLRAFDSSLLIALFLSFCRSAPSLHLRSLPQYRLLPLLALSPRDGTRAAHPLPSPSPPNPFSPPVAKPWRPYGSTHRACRGHAAASWSATAKVRWATKAAALLFASGGQDAAGRATDTGTGPIERAAQRRKDRDLAVAVPELTCQSLSLLLSCARDAKRPALFSSPFHMRP